MVATDGGRPAAIDEAIEPHGSGEVEADAVQLNGVGQYQVNYVVRPHRVDWQLSDGHRTLSGRFTPAWPAWAPPWQQRQIEPVAATIVCEEWLDLLTDVGVLRFHPSASEVTEVADWSQGPTAQATAWLEQPTTFGQVVPRG